MAVSHLSSPGVQTTILPPIILAKLNPSPPQQHPHKLEFAIKFLVRDFETWGFLDEDGHDIDYTVVSKEITCTTSSSSEPAPPPTLLLVPTEDEDGWIIHARAALTSIGLQPEFHDHVINTLRSRVGAIITDCNNNNVAGGRVDVSVEIHRRLDYRIITAGPDGYNWKTLNGQMCAVCLEQLKVNPHRHHYDWFDDRAAVRLPCQHAFHKICIKTWFNKSDTCPLCRHPCFSYT